MWSVAKTLKSEDGALRQDSSNFVRELIKKMIRFLKVSKLLELEWNTRWRVGHISVESTDVWSVAETLKSEVGALSYDLSNT